MYTYRLEVEAKRRELESAGEQVVAQAARLQAQEDRLASLQAQNTRRHFIFYIHVELVEFNRDLWRKWIRQELGEDWFIEGQQWTYIQGR